MEASLARDDLVKYLSVCSGIEAATVAWDPLGWQPLAFSEIEPFPSAVLAHHWPDVPNLGDFTTIQRADFEEGGRAWRPSQTFYAATQHHGKVESDVAGPVTAQQHQGITGDLPLVGVSTAPTYPDVLVGGTPCQAFSVAGLRESLDDHRGNLTLEFVRLADRLDDGQLIVVWENVPGVLSTKDNAFGCFLGALVGCDTALVPTGKRWSNAGVVSGPERVAAWRVLDAQYFGVAQRRRRVFVVASARADFDPAAVLLERDGVRRDSPPSREAREGVAGGAALGFASSSHGSFTASDGGGVCAVTEATSEEAAKPSCADARAYALGSGEDVSGPILRGPQGMWGNDLDGHGAHVVEPRYFADVSRSNKRQNGPGYTDTGCAFTLTVGDTPGVVEPIVPAVSPTLSSREHKGPSCGRDGMTSAVVIEPIAFACKDYGGDVGEIAPTLRSMHEANSTPNGGGQVAVAYRKSRRAKDADDFETWVPAETSNTLNAFDDAGDIRATHAIAFSAGNSEDAYGIGASVEHTPPLRASSSGTNQVPTCMTPAMAVRRLTPRECERLQGFPDDHTRIPWRKKAAEDCPDGPRYKACGNSMAVPCMFWIGRRIDLVTKENPS